MEIKDLFTKTHHSQCSGEVDDIKEECPGRSGHVDTPKSWELYTDAINFAYNTHVHWVATLPHFEVLFSWMPPHLDIEAQPTVGSFPCLKFYRETWKTWQTKIAPVIWASTHKVEQTYKKIIMIKYVGRSPFCSLVTFPCFSSCIIMLRSSVVTSYRLL